MQKTTSALPATLDRSPSNTEVVKLFIAPNDPLVQSTLDEISQKPKLFIDFEAMRDWVSLYITYKSGQDVHCQYHNVIGNITRINSK